MGSATSARTATDLLRIGSLASCTLPIVCVSLVRRIDELAAPSLVAGRAACAMAAAIDRKRERDGWGDTEFGGLDPRTNSHRNCESELDPTQEWGVRVNVAPQDAELGAVLRPIRVSSKPPAPQTHKRIIHSYPHAAAFPRSLPMFDCVPISHQGLR